MCVEAIDACDDAYAHVHVHVVLDMVHSLLLSFSNTGILVLVHDIQNLVHSLLFPFPFSNYGEPSHMVEGSRGSCHVQEPHARRLRLL